MVASNVVASDSSSELEAMPDNFFVNTRVELVLQTTTTTTKKQLVMHLMRNDYLNANVENF